MNKLFVARDHNGQLWLHFKKPVRTGWVWQSDKCIEVQKELFPEVTWESKPREVKIV